MILDRISIGKLERDLLLLACESGEGASIVSLAQETHCAPMSVRRTAQRLDAAGLAVLGRYGTLTLTEEGELAARRVKRRLALVEAWLCRLRGSAGAVDEAAAIEPLLSEETLAALELSLAETSTTLQPSIAWRGERKN